jgi:sirohydrochlorin ferrochelatase
LRREHSEAKEVAVIFVFSYHMAVPREKMEDEEAEPVQRRILEGLSNSRYYAENALQVGIEALGRLRKQGDRLLHADGNLTPIGGMTDQSEGMIGAIMSSLGSGRRLFYVLAGATVLILFFVIRWKRSG